MAYVDLRPDQIREVQVLIDGTWHHGDLEAYRQGHEGILDRLRPLVSRPRPAELPRLV